jgi:peptidoglycan/xylan/chitin deacetylase (PgdA/CDA1 family)
MFLFRKKSSANASGSRLEIILYHFVSDKQNDFTLSGHTVTPGEFRREMEYLTGRYTIVSLGEVAGLGKIATEKPRTYAAICFDDGYRCILEEAYPILREMRLPSTIFINPPVLGNRDLLWRDKIRYLIRIGQEEEFVSFLRSQGGSYNFGSLKGLGFYKWSKNPKALRSMAIQKDIDLFFSRKGFDASAIASANDLFLEEEDIVPRDFLEFGNHTWSHPILTLQPAASQKDEIVKCHDYLRAKGISPVGLSLPFSPYDRHTVAVCRELDYTYLLTVFGRTNYLPSGNRDRPIVLHRRMAPKEATGFISIV